MKNDILASLIGLSDTLLVARVKDLIAREMGVTAEVIAHIAEMDTRDIHLREGYPSLYVYCRDVLRLSEWEAYNRIEVGRAAREFPVILEMLAEGSVNLTTIKLLVPHLTQQNHREVLSSAAGKRKTEVQAIVARLAPRPDVPFTVRRLPVPRHESSTVADAVVCSAPSVATSHGSVSNQESVASLGCPPAPSPGSAPLDGPMAPVQGALVPSPPVPPTSVSVATPLSPDRYKLQLTISADTLKKMRLAKDMLAHAIPEGDDAQVLDRAFTALLAELAKKKFADTSAPGRSRARKPGARSPSAAVKRAVWLRDLGRCAFVGSGGHRCGERRFVEFHHVDPYALGGEATVDGIQLRCRRHNDYEGRLYFGRKAPEWRATGATTQLVPEQVGLSASRSC